MATLEYALPTINRYIIYAPSIYPSHFILTGNRNIINTIESGKVNANARKIDILT